LAATVGAVTSAMKKGGMVTLVGFGTFYVGKRSARSGRNPRTGAQIKIRAARVPKFRAGKALKDAVNSRTFRAFLLARVSGRKRAIRGSKQVCSGQRGFSESYPLRFAGGRRGCLAQLVERRPYKANVGGSSPSAPTIGV